MGVKSWFNSTVAFITARYLGSNATSRVTVTTTEPPMGALPIPMSDDGELTLAHRPLGHFRGHRAPKCSQLFAVGDSFFVVHEMPSPTLRNSGMLDKRSCAIKRRHVVFMDCPPAPALKL